MATVWIADDPVLSRRVAVKILRADLASDDALRTRFRNEAIAAAKLTHPNVVATYDTGDDDGTAYIVMELVSGPTLRKILDEVGGLPVRDVLRIGIQVADALDAAHRAGLVHRDVKPANVLVPEAGSVKVTDFGIAKAVGVDDLTRTGTVMGTARYLAPEQVNGRPTDARTDVYALGLLLYEMLCGKPPFGGDTDISTAMARLTTSAPAVRSKRADVPGALDDVVHRCLARSPDARFHSAGDVRDALEHVRAVRPAPPVARPAPPVARPAPVAPAPVPRAPVPPAPATAARPAPAARPPVKRRRRSLGWLWVTLAVLLVLGLAAAAIVLAASNDDNSPGSSGARTSAAVVRPVGAVPFDPPPGDGQEDNADAPKAIDGNPATAWSTEHYKDPLHATKAGVGLVIDLGTETDVRRVTVDASASGWSAAIYVDAQPGAALSDWGKPVAQGTGLGTQHEFDFASTHGRYVLLWLTALPFDAANDYYALQVSEVAVA
jgi:serine/threonine-protein kinase